MNKIIFILLFLFLASFLAVIPFFNNGFFDFHDNTQVVRVYEMGIMLSQKIFPVRWVPDLGYGYGYPIFNFYGPLPYYIGGLIYSLGFDALLSTKIMMVLGILLSAISMYFFSRRFFGEIGGISSAIVYMYFPYHAVNTYVRGSVGELFAYAFIPLFFLGFYDLISKKKLGLYGIMPMVLIAFGFFLTATSHNISILMMLILIVPASLIGYFLADSKKTFLYFGIGGVIVGIILSSFYIFPAFFEMKYTNVSSQIGGGADFRDHYMCAGQYWDSAWGFGGSAKGCVDGMSFKLGKSNIAFFIFSVILSLYAIYNRKFRIYEKAVLLSFILLLISVFLTLPQSKIIWENIPFMEFIQYPWRFINFIALFGAFSIGYLVFFIREKGSREFAFIGMAVIIIVTILFNGKLFTPQIYNYKDESFYTDKKYINFTASKISDEYLPRGFLKPSSILEVPTTIALARGTESDISIENTEKPIEIRINYEAESNGYIHINRAYFPSWKASLNTSPVNIIPRDDGMDIPVVKGRGSILLKFENTPIQLFSNVLSVVALIVLIIVIIFVPRIKK